MATTIPGTAVAFIGPQKCRVTNWSCKPVVPHYYHARRRFYRLQKTFTGIDFARTHDWTVTWTFTVDPN